MHAFPRASPQLLRTCAGILLVLTSYQVHARDITVTDVRAVTINDIVHIDVNLSIELSQDVIDALNSGIPITFQLAAELIQKRSFWFDNTAVRTVQRYLISRHALSEQYVITNLVTGDREYFFYLRNAIARLERWEEMPLAESRYLEEGKRYIAAVRAKVDLDALPAPMRPGVYISPAWWISSKWHEWEVTP